MTTFMVERNVNSREQKCCVQDSVLVLFKKYILITTVWLLLCPNPIGTSRLRLPSRDLRSVSKPHLKAICHNSLLIMQSADPDQALEEIMGGIETPYSNGLWTDSKSIWFTHISDFFSLFSYPEEVQG